MTLHPLPRTLPPSRWTRRAFLRAMSLASGAVALATAGADRLWAAIPFRRSEPLTEAEVAELVALGVALFAPRDESEIRLVERTARWWARGRSGDDDDRLAAYRAGLAELGDRLVPAAGGRSLSALAPDARTALVADLLAPGGPAAFAALAAELLHGLWGSEPGWRRLGYTTWPGVFGSPHAYTRPPPPLPR